MASIENWTEGVILSLVFVVVLGGIVAELNLIYGKSYTLPFSDDSNANQTLINYQDQAETQISGSDVEFSAEEGITVKASWSLLKNLGSILWNFITGSWIINIASNLNLGEAGMVFAWALRVMFFLSIFFAMFYSLFKVVT